MQKFTVNCITFRPLLL